MNVYYSRTELTISKSREVFTTDRINKIDHLMHGKSIEYLKKALLNIHKKEDLVLFRLGLFSISKALTIYGIAPRWQDLEDACNTDEEREALIVDAPLIDLFWLQNTFPNHKTNNKRWGYLFENGFDIDLALAISERQINTARKIENNLNLTRFEQIGCIHFIKKSPYKANNQDSASTFIKKAENRTRTAYNKEIDRCASIPQMTTKIAYNRCIEYLCWLLAENSPTKAAIIYKWRTGATKDKANIARTIVKMKKPIILT